jgi:hypothetical protein
MGCGHQGSGLPFSSTRSKGLRIYQQAALQKVRERGSINIVEVCNLVLTELALKKDPSFKPSI